MDADPHADIQVSVRDMTLREAASVLGDAGAYALMMAIMVGIPLALLFGGSSLLGRAFGEVGESVLRDVLNSPVTWLLLGAAASWPLQGIAADTAKGIGVFIVGLGLMWQRTSLRGRFVTAAVVALLVAGFAYWPIPTGIALLGASSLASAIEDWRGRKRQEIVDARADT
jgi:hypothetical protein